jgi:hypothetical protein
MSPRSFFVSACAILTGLAAAGPARAAESPPRPALVVVIAIDQFRADYLTRFRPHFTEDGFRLLTDRGANFTEAHFRHSVTKTACGHAVIATGVHADVHGIIANDWIDRGTMLRVGCVEDRTVQVVGLEPPAGLARPSLSVPVGVSPRGLSVPTVSDLLKESTGGKSRTFGLSSKERSAIILGGRRADAAYWMEKGRIVTSSYYMAELPSWVRAFNGSGRIDSYYGKTWDRLLPAAAYEAIQGADDVPGESADQSLPRTFPKKIDGGAPVLGAGFYDAFESAPFKNDVLVEFARELTVREELGRRGVTDFLGLSFSTNDTVGHRYGPDSHEVMDITLRTDRMLADFFRFLDGHVGLANCLIVLSADHGAPQLPELLKARDPRADAGRIDLVAVLRTCQAALDRAFGAAPEGKRWLTSDATALLFFRDTLAAKKVAAADAERVVREALLTLPFVGAAYTRTQLIAGDAPGEAGAAMLRSFHRDRSADVIYQPKPNWFDRTTGVNHSTPYRYDTHVPLVFFGAGVPAGARPERVGMDDAAPTLLALLGLPTSAQMRGRNLFAR